MEQALVDEWKPTFLQQNLGTLIPFLVDGVTFSPPASFTGRAIYSSLAFENSAVKDFTLRDGTFVNASLRGVDWRDVLLESMAMGELLLDQKSNFANVAISRCRIEGVRIEGADGEETREYAPARIKRALEEFGFSFVEEELPIDDSDEVSDSSNIRLLRKLLRMFHRTTIVSDENLRSRFGGDFTAVESQLMPLLVEHGVVEKRKWRGSGNHQAWTLAVSLDDFIAAEGTVGQHGDTWRALQSAK